MAEKARELILKGDKKTKKFFGGSSKYEDARDLYLEAVNQFKKVQDWQGATGAIEKAIEMDDKLKDDSDRVEHLKEAIKTSRKYDFDKAVAFTQQVLMAQEKQGQYARAAKLAEDTAANYKEKFLDEMFAEQTDKLVEWYERAISYWKMERHSKASISSCRQKIAELRLQQQKYQEAFELFETIGREFSEDEVLMLSARPHFFSALLCLLALITPEKKEEGIDKFRSKFEEYQERCTQFDKTLEQRFINGIIQAFEEEDPKLYAEPINKFERSHPLDPARNLAVLRGKAVLSSDEDLR